MKKLSVIIVILVVIGVVWFLTQGKNNTKPNLEATPQQASATLPEQNTNIISSIKDAMGLGKKMACTYTPTDGTNTSSTIFIDGQKMKFTTPGSGAYGEATYSILDSDTQYIWTTGEKKQGMKMNKTCLAEIKNLVPQQASSGNAPKTQDYQSLENMQNVSCVEDTHEDFSLPTDITFTDQCEIMRKAMQGINQEKGKIPGNITIPTGY